MIKTIAKKIIFGRENGFRAKIFKAEDTSPNSSFSAPPQEDFDSGVQAEKEAPKNFLKRQKN